MERLVFGTWQFALKNSSKAHMYRVVSYALERGIQWFDTAFVYGGGNQERLLGDFPQSKVITKIPAREKPTVFALPLEQYYSPEYIQELCEQSILRLKRPADILLLHNWADEWNDHPELFQCMLDLKQQGKCGNIGISLPDTYQGRVIPFPFDWVMAPLNDHANWIQKNYHALCPETQICIRSLFDRGAAIPEDRLQRIERIRTADFADKVVIGMTREATVDEDIQIFKGATKNEKYQVDRR